MPAYPDAIPPEVLKDARTALDRLGVDWYVFGAVAVMSWSLPRITADLDITARVPAHQIDELCQALAAQGFRLRVADRDNFLQKTRVIPFLHTATGRPLDLVLAASGAEDLFFSRSVLMPVAGVEVPVASAEDLIVMKILAGRPKDLEDVRMLFASRLALLDLAQIHDLLELLEQALDQSDLLPAWERELAAARG